MMIKKALTSHTFAVASCALFLAGLAGLPICMVKDLKEDRPDFPKSFVCLGISGLGVIGEYIYIVAKIL